MNFFPEEMKIRMLNHFYLPNIYYNMFLHRNKLIETKLGLCYANYITYLHWC